MRSRLSTAAFATLAGALWAAAPACAETKVLSPRLVLAGAADASPALIKSPVFSDWSPFAGNGIAPAERASSLLAPGLSFDVSRWRDAAFDSWPSHVAGSFGGPVLADSNRSSYLGLGSGGLYAGASIALSDNLRLHIGRTTSSLGLVTDGSAPSPNDLLARIGTNIGRIETDTAGFAWSPNDWSVLGITASRRREFGSVLGDSVAAPLANAETAALGISARIGFGEGWVTTIAYNQGVTQLNLNQNGFAANFETLRSQAFGFAVAKQGVFGDDSLGIAVSRPLRLNYSGAALAGANAPSSYVPNTASARESDIQLGYVTTFLDGALALQANAAYQVNANGDKGQDAVSVLSRAKIKF